MRRVIVLGVLSLFALCVWSFGLEIHGEVISLDGKPVSRAVVLHRPSGNKILTDDRGLFSLRVPESEKIKLEIIHPGYIDQEIVLSAKNLSNRVVISLVPYIRQREEVVVTALRYPEAALSVPAAGTVLTKETLTEKMSSTITESLLDVPGISGIGSGGFTLVPAIRGQARRRVLIMVDNARLTSDRRTGPNASFVDPLIIDKIEVLRSSSSVFYGSDAIGGVIHIFTRKAGLEDGIRGKLSTRFGTVNREKGLGFSLEGSNGKTGFYLSFQGADAKNYSSPTGKVEQSQFTQASVFGKISHQSNEREIHMSFLGARGVNIGKPNRDSRDKPTWYPLESQNLLQFHWTEKSLGESGDLSFQFFINPNSLETQKETIRTHKTKEEYSRTASMDFGFQATYGHRLTQDLRLAGGMDFYGRGGVEAFNRYRNFNDLGEVTETQVEYPYTRGWRSDLGFFLSADYSGVRGLDLVAGLRVDRLEMKAHPGNAGPEEKTRHNALTGFLGGSFKLSELISVYANLSRAYRVPGLSERFYTGITGRGFIIAQPGLKPETNLGLDLGLRFIHKKFFAGLYSFVYEIDDMIERYRIADTVYTYGNIDRARIRGVELEMEYYPIPGWKIFGSLFSINGRSLKTNNRLNDIPPVRLVAGTKVWARRLSVEINGTIQQRKLNPGPAEIRIDGSEVVNIKASYFFNPSLSVHFVLSNLLNNSYLARPDPEAVEEPGRNFVFGLSCAF